MRHLLRTLRTLQVYLLERLAAGDLTTGKLLLHAVVSVADRPARFTLGCAAAGQGARPGGDVLQPLSMCCLRNGARWRGALCGECDKQPAAVTAPQARAMQQMSDKSIPEFAPFGFTLALRMQNLVKGGRPQCARLHARHCRCLWLLHA